MVGLRYGQRTLSETRRGRSESRRRRGQPWWNEDATARRDRGPNRHWRTTDDHDPQYFPHSRRGAFGCRDCPSGRGCGCGRRADRPRSRRVRHRHRRGHPGRRLRRQCRHCRVQGDTVRSAAGRRPALAPARAGSRLGGGAGRIRERRDLHPERRTERHPGRGLPVPQRLGAARDERAAAGAVLDPRGRLHRRLRIDRPLRRHAARRRRGGGGHHQLPPERLRLPGASGPVGRVAARRVRQLRPAGHGGGARMGPRQHRDVRRRPRPGDHLRRVGRRRRGHVGHAHPAGRGAVPRGNRPEQLDQRLGPAVERGGARLGGGRGAGAAGGHCARDHGEYRRGAGRGARGERRRRARGV